MGEAPGADAANVVVDDAEAHRLNLAAITSAQQVVDLSAKLLANDGKPPLEATESGWPDYQVMFTTGQADLPVIHMRASGHGSETTGDMHSAAAVSWNVSVHMPKTSDTVPGQMPRLFKHALADKTIGVTTSSTHLDVPSTSVYDPWLLSRGDPEQQEITGQRLSGEAPTLADFAASSRAS